MTGPNSESARNAAEIEVKFCHRCGAPVSWKDRFGRKRPSCSRCEWVYFPDPKVAAAALIERQGQVLLVRRANDPERGKWTLPAGFVDAGEDPARAAERECLEETGLQVRVIGLVDVLYGQEHSRGAHIIIFYRADVIDGSIIPGDDVDRVAFFSLQDLPILAFETTKKILSPDR